MEFLVVSCLLLAAGSSAAPFLGLSHSSHSESGSSSQHAAASDSARVQSEQQLEGNSRGDEYYHEKTAEEQSRATHFDRTDERQTHDSTSYGLGGAELVGTSDDTRRKDTLEQNTSDTRRRTDEVEAESRGGDTRARGRHTESGASHVDEKATQEETHSKSLRVLGMQVANVNRYDSAAQTASQDQAYKEESSY